MLEQSTGVLAFEEPGLLAVMEAASIEELDALPFGVIHFDSQFIVRRYNRYEMESAGVQRDQVAGRHVFTQVAQCMNNFLVAQRFEDAMATSVPLDAVIDYTLTWRMRPTPVRLRLLCDGSAGSGGYVLILRFV